MEHLTDRDIEQLLGCIRSAYDLQDPTTFARDSLVILNQLVSTEIRVIDDRHQDRSADLYRLPSGNSLTAKGRLLLNLIQPHLSQALQTARQLKQQQQEILRLRQSIDIVGLIFLDKTGKLDWMTAQADRLIQQYLPRSTNADRQALPSRLQAWIDLQIAELDNPSHPVCSPSLSLLLKQDRTELTIRLVTNSAEENNTLLLEEKPIQILNTSLELLGLSTREAEVLAYVIQGQTPKEIAKNLDISVSTTRKHLENIYRKLEVQSQTEAVTTALAKLGIFAPLPIS